MATSIHTTDFQILFDSARDAGYRVVAPVREDTVTLFKPVESAGEIVLDEILPTKSPKEYFLAEHEPILTYSRDNGELKIENPPEGEIAPPMVLFGVRPCDAAGPEIIREVMTWDSNDEFFLKRREVTVVIAIACVEADYACYCTSVGQAPDGTEGVDILLLPTSDKTGESQEYLVNPITDKGREFVKATKGWKEGNPRPSAAIEQVKKKLEKRFDTDKIKEWLDSGFDDDFWNTAALSCIGCGTCTYLCPTCHCFDIVDEGDVDGGIRMKNWDSCQMSQFTIHASGHNPRTTQNERFRQRIMHKFKYYPDLFGRILCTGCGRCQRSCPVDLALVKLLEQIHELACEPAGK